MKTFNAAVFSLVVAVPFFSVAHPLESVLKNLGLVAQQVGNKPLDNVGDIEPIRFAKAKVRLIKHTPIADPDWIGFEEKDICILQSDRLPVYELRASSTGGIYGLRLECSDPEASTTVYLSSLIALTKGTVIDRKEEVKVATLSIYGSSRLPGFLDSSSNFATKDLSLKSMILLARPEVNYRCKEDSSGKRDCSGRQVFYSAIVDIED